MRFTKTQEGSKKKSSTEGRKAKGEGLQELTLLQQEESCEEPIRSFGIVGDIDETKVSEALCAFLNLKNSGKENLLIEENGEEVILEVIKPFELYISTDGGDATDMFAIYDAMRLIQDRCEIHTVGLGKVMSAGVLLLAAGNKGDRKIGANCRVMIHSVVAGQVGPLHDLENELEEVKWLQDRYISALAQETDMTKKYIEKLLKRKVNVYLSAEEAVDLGIADIVV